MTKTAILALALCGGFNLYAQESAPAEAQASTAAAPAAAAALPAVGSSMVRNAEAEWKFLRETADEERVEVIDAAIEDLDVFVEQHPDSPNRADALFILASLRQKKGDYKPAMVDLLKLLHEYPGSKMSLQAKSAFLDLAEKRLNRKLKPAAGELVRTPEAESAAERLALLLEKLSTSMEDSLYEPTALEIRRFQMRFQDYPGLDKLQWSLAQLQERSAKYAAALLSYRKLLSVYQDSPYRSKAQFAMGSLYAERLRDYKKAIEAYQELVDKYPGSGDVLPALEQTAQLFSEKLRQYELAVEVEQRIVKLFPKTPGALKAFQDMARLQRDRLGRPLEAIETYKRVAEQFRAHEGVQALQSAAAIARKDLKDYNMEIELRRKIAEDFAADREASQELYSVAEIYEGDLNDVDKAIEVYREVSSKFPGTKASGKAESRAAKLEKRRQS
ncbi:MAG: tetratricopeptide repeat protein [Elusimicrobia bacterium]|nr:tetratricopeptide repeat protein [Elusimicrobiota bacterium]